MQSLSQIRELLESHGLRPKHRLGQNFLHDKNQLAKLIDAAQVKTGDLVLEVGPGTGTLTGALSNRGVEVIACEIDSDLADLIAEEFAEVLVDRLNPPRGRGGSLRLIRGDALEKQRRLNPEIVQAIATRPFKLVANLPYQIASPLISALLTDHANCTGMFVTIQKEVADRLAAKPGTKEYGPLSIIVQALATITRIATLRPSCFWPEPEVTSAMLAITPNNCARNNCLKDVGDRREFARFIVDLFSKRRKQLGTILGRARASWPAGVTSDLRPEALTVTQLIELWRSPISPQ